MKIIKKKREKYIIVKKADKGLHISVHKSGHVHVKNKTGLHVDVEGQPAIALKEVDLEKLKSTLTGIPCEKYPDCICIDLTLNPYLIEEGLGELCIALQNFFNGGLCPIHPQGKLCKWAGFCKRGIDPTPFVKSLF